MSSSEEEIKFSPNTLMEREKEKILPAKSMQIYLNAYESFMRWRAEKQMNTFSENVFLTYFDELSKKLQPSTLWSVYSMLKTTLRMKNDVHINAYVKLTSLLKRLSTGHIRKKSRVLSAKHVEVFLNTAPDKQYLATKVALIYGISGACRGIELTNLTLDNVKTESQLQVINLQDSNTNKEKTFVVTGEYLNIVKKYQALRPDNLPNNRFFLNYQNGKCTRQAIGRNKFAKMPKEIATFLKLQNPGSYTGHCFRRTSATLLADSGVNLNMLTQHGGTSATLLADSGANLSMSKRHGGTSATLLADSGANLSMSKRHGGTSATLLDDSGANLTMSNRHGGTSVTLLADSGANLTMSKRHGGWQPDQVAEVYIEEFVEQKPKICDILTDGINLVYNAPGPSKVDKNEDPMTSEDAQAHDNPTISSKVQSNTINMPGKTINLQLSNCSNVSLHFH